MLQSIREERSRQFKMALRIAIPTLLFVSALAYGVFFREKPIDFNFQNIVLMSATTFVIVYFIFFALELSRKETLLDRVTGGFHYDAFIRRVYKKKPKYLAVIQIDNLSEINENFGVAKTDQLLRSLINYLNEDVLYKLDKGALIGRKMGAEILIALDADSESIDDALSNFIKKHKDVDGVEVELNYALIHYNIDDLEKSLEQLRDLVIRKASTTSTDNALNIVDAKGISQREKMIIETLHSNGVSLSFRPLLNLATGRKSLYEIGVRMQSDNEIISPKEFLPVINRHNLGEEYDLLIFSKIVEVASLVDDNISFSFNLSPYSLRKDSFLNACFKKLDDSNISPNRLIIELYERRKYRSLDIYLDRLKEIKQKGIRLCLDNFGASNASMDYLRTFAFDMIQFDRDYTKDIETTKGYSIVQSFVTMAKEMNMQTVAKWVDTSDKVEIFKSIGVDYIQGYIAGRVMKEDEFLRYHNPIRKAN